MYQWVELVNKRPKPRIQYRRAVGFMCGSSTHHTVFVGYGKTPQLAYDDMMQKAGKWLIENEHRLELRKVGGFPSSIFTSKVTCGSYLPVP